jgi:hypothetical protein
MKYAKKPKMNYNKIKNRRGSALLVALLVMGVLMAVSLILSSLIFREIRITNDVVHAGKAYYAAESGIELALYELNNNLPGWETSKEGGISPQYEAMSFGDDDDVVGEYRVSNTCRSYPCFDEGYDTSNVPLQQYYASLDLNESITIPLFVVDDEVEKAAENFTVQFYGAFKMSDLFLSGKVNEKLYGWDVLRWKLFGIYNGGEEQDDAATSNSQTETISDFTAISTEKQYAAPEAEDVINGQADFGNIAKVPSWFGSIMCGPHAGIRETDLINCAAYSPKKTYKSTKLYEDGDSENQGYEADLVLGQCDNTEAREVYVYGGDGKLDENDEIADCYPIKSFLENHHLNYLVLTNLMNPAIFKESDPVKKNILSRLYYRIEVYGDDRIVRDHATIQANGYSGDIKQSMQVQIKRGSYLPVFNFTLYSTYKDKVEGETCAAYYGEEDCVKS